MTERQEIARDKAKAQKNSGRGFIQKGDAILGPFCLDYKEASKSFSLNMAVWAKLCSDSFHSRKSPALKVILGETDKVRLFIIEEAMFHDMLEAWEERENGRE